MQHTTNVRTNTQRTAGRPVFGYAHVDAGLAVEYFPVNDSPLAATIAPTTTTTVTSDAPVTHATIDVMTAAPVASPRVAGPVVRPASRGATSFSFNLAQACGIGWKDYQDHTQRRMHRDDATVMA